MLVQVSTLAQATSPAGRRQVRHMSGWRSGSAVGSYPTGCRFESCPRHRMPDVKCPQRVDWKA